ncbi:GNAT family N-acetyltransferase [Streptomyces sp. NBC_01476]|uniref:GNAT family N-acetyltransferase n=1 Tax=Streptomyces sp. NBC_01476 TaxID=2903881 RepID=UPI002E2FD822|nr:GNAT family N-acetyltransferase [Streptomyces sp. NBC_01476]
MHDQPFSPSRIDSAVRAWGAAFRIITSAEPTMRHYAGRQETHVVFTGSQAASTNGVFSFSAPPDPDEIALLAGRAAETAAQYPEFAPWCVQVRGRPDERIRREAARHGLTDESWEPFMVRDLDRSPSTDADAAPGSPELRIRAVSGAEHDLYLTAMSTGFQVPKEVFAALFTPAVINAPAVTAYIGEVDGEAVCTAMGVVTDGHVGVFNVSTAPAHRKRGLGARMTEHVVRAGHHAGARTAYLRASEMGLGVYESVGFSTAEHWTYLSAP